MKTKKTKAAQQAPAQPRKITCLVSRLYYDDPQEPHNAAMDAFKAAARDPRCPVLFDFTKQVGMADHYKAYDHLLRLSRQAKADFTLFVDGDMTPTIADALTLIGAGKQFIGALYIKRLKTNVDQFVLQTLDGADFDPRIMRHQKVKRIGMGCTLIGRVLLDGVEKLFPELKFAVSPNEGSGMSHGFFMPYIDQKNFERVSGDFAFCDRVRAVGEDAAAKLANPKSKLKPEERKHLEFLRDQCHIWVDCGTPVDHWGRYPFRPSYKHQEEK